MEKLWRLFQLPGTFFFFFSQDRLLLAKREQPFHFRGARWLVVAVPQGGGGAACSLGSLGWAFGHQQRTPALPSANLVYKPSDKDCQENKASKAGFTVACQQHAKPRRHKLGGNPTNANERPRPVRFIRRVGVAVADLRRTNDVSAWFSLFSL